MMRVGSFITGLAALSCAAAAFAEPVKAPVSKADQAVEQGAPVIVASADEPAPEAAPQSQQDNAPAAKPVRSARVTTCRCGDQNPSN